MCMYIIAYTFFTFHDIMAWLCQTFPCMMDLSNDAYVPQLLVAGGWGDTYA